MLTVSSNLLLLHVPRSMFQEDPLPDCPMDLSEALRCIPQLKGLDMEWEPEPT